MASVKTTRQERGRLLFDGGVRPVEIGPDKWVIRSAKTPRSYVVERWGGDNWACECGDSQYRGFVCKHAELVRMCIAAEEPKTCETCETCSNAHNKKSIYVWCVYERANFEHEHTCGHWCAPKAHEQSREKELIVVC
jgi:hypothetical protein